jgi:poly(hydroxyalkanoate) granule-associated protein
MPAKKLTTIPADVTAAVQKIWQAGLGAVTMAQDEGGKMFEVLVSVGEQMEKEIRRSGLTPSAAVKKASAGAEDAWKKVQAALDSQMTGVLHRLGVPTRDEIARLTRRIEHLTETIESLRARPAAARRPAVRKATARKTTTRARR